MTYNLPIEIIDDSLKHMRYHMNSTKITTFHRPALYILTELNSYARHIYNVINFFLFLNNLKYTLSVTIHHPSLHYVLFFLSDISWFVRV